MARLSLNHTRVKNQVQFLVTLFLKLGSVNAVSEEINKVARVASPKAVIYPNRIHTLLSEETERGVNEATIALLETVSSRLDLDNVENQLKPVQLKDIEREVLRAWYASKQTLEEVKEIAVQSSLPPAVVRHLVTGSQKVGQPLEPNSVTVKSDSDLATDSLSLEPDWSFQKRAYYQCLQALAKVNNKVGLIIPTGGGKTRVGLRIVLGYLATTDKSGDALWFAHRISLKEQAEAELKAMLADPREQLPANARHLSQRIRFEMISNIPERVERINNYPVLVVVDEAHHAAASSYQPIFQTPYPLAGLFLTATPNRSDKLDIGIDEIAFSITYRELYEHGVILSPDFEEFPVEDFNWSTEKIADLADYIIQRTEGGDFVKTLVIAPRTDRVEEFYHVLLERIANDHSQVLSPDDLGFIHNEANSLNVSPREFIEVFKAKSQGILVSAQMLLEGFNDPTINAVVITYPSSSLIVLMQAAGRCVRYAPGKRKAYVVQAKNESLSYYYDHRWLYKEISDYLRPSLLDIDYIDHKGLQQQLEHILHTHKVSNHIRARILSEVKNLAPGETCRLLLSGLPYFGARTEFYPNAQWSAFLEYSKNSDAFRKVFNTYSYACAYSPDPLAFMDHYAAQFGIQQDPHSAADYRLYVDMLMSMEQAYHEIYTASKGILHSQRPYQPNHSTTWLKYITFHFRPRLPANLTAFLSDCFNKQALTVTYLENDSFYFAALKIPTPLGNAYEAFLLHENEYLEFRGLLDECKNALLEVEPWEQFKTMAGFLASVEKSSLPLRVVNRLENFLKRDGLSRYILSLRE